MNIRDELAELAALNKEGHGIWTTKEWAQFVKKADALDWAAVLAAWDKLVHALVRIEDWTKGEPAMSGTKYSNMLNRERINIAAYEALEKILDDS